MTHLKILSIALFVCFLVSCSKILDKISPDTQIDANDEIGSIANSLKFSSENAATAFIRQDGSLWMIGASDLTTTGGSNVDKPIQIGEDKDWIGVSVGYKAVFALKKNGTLWSWGEKAFVGRTGDSWSPTKVNEDTDWKYVHCGTYNTFAIKRDGSLWGCGQGNYNGSGLFGDGTLNDRPILTRVGKQSDWKLFNILGSQIFAVKSDGTLWGWGYAQNKASRQMLYGSDDSQLNAVKIGKNDNWVKISPTGAAVIGLRKDGTIWGWGTNGTEIIAPENSIKLNNDSDWRDIAANSKNGVALKKDGIAWVFASNSIGHLPTETPYSGDELKGPFIVLETVGALSGILAQRKGEDTYCWASASMLVDVRGIRFFSENGVFKRCATLN